MKNEKSQPDSGGKLDFVEECSWVNNHIGGESFVLLDCRYFLPTEGKKGIKEYNKEHIPTASFFDIDSICDTETDLPHMLPTVEFFSEQIELLGIKNGDYVICYDGGNGSMAAMRVFWMFQVFGHKSVSILNGGLAEWKKMKYQTVSGEEKREREKYKIEKLNLSIVKNIDDIFRNIETREVQIVDARSHGRFCGKEPEPRSGIKQGHMPGSINLPFAKLYENNSAKLSSPSYIMSVLNKGGIDPKKPIISSCGSGVTAAVLYFYLKAMGHDTVSIFDGSWTEWGSRPDTKISSEVK